MTAAGIELAYETLGDPSLPCLLLIQGLGAQLMGWRDDFCEEFLSRGFFVVRFDNRDVGRSQRFPATEYTLADMADDTASLVTALDVGPAHVVGQSMGGMIAQELALRYPDLVLSLALLYTSASRNWLIGRDELGRRSEAESPSTRHEAIADYVDAEKACASSAYPQDGAWLRILGGLMFDSGMDPAGVERQTDAIFRSSDRVRRLRTLTLPTIVLAGDADQLIDPRASEELHDVIGGSQLVLFSGMGHELPRPLWDQIVTAVVSNIHRAVPTVVF